MRVEREGGAAAGSWDPGGARCTGTGTPQLQEGWPFCSLLEPLVAGDETASLAGLSP